MPTVVYVAFAVSALLTATAAYTDTKTGLIPNWITFPPIIIAPVLHAIYFGTHGLMVSVLGIFVCGFLPFIMFKMGGMGGGDVKLFAAVGGLLGLQFGLQVEFLSMLVGAVFSIGMLLRAGRLRALFSNTATMIGNVFRPSKDKVAIEHHPQDTLRLGFSIFIGNLLAIGLQVSRFKGLV